MNVDERRLNLWKSAKQPIKSNILSEKAKEMIEKLTKKQWEVNENIYEPHIIELNPNEKIQCNVLVNEKVFPAEYEVENIFVSHEGRNEYLVRFKIK